MPLSTKNVCRRLRDERTRLKLSQSQVAHSCGVSVKTVSRWEKSIPIPSDKLALLSELGYDISYIITGIETKPETYGLELAALAEDKKDSTSPLPLTAESWLKQLESMTSGDADKLRELGLVLIGYSELSKKT